MLPHFASEPIVLVNAAQRRPDFHHVAHRIRSDDSLNVSDRIISFAKDLRELPGQFRLRWRWYLGPSIIRLPNNVVLVFVDGDKFAHLIGDDRNGNLSYTGTLVRFTRIQFGDGAIFERTSFCLSCCNAIMGVRMPVGECTVWLPQGNRSLTERNIALWADEALRFISTYGGAVYPVVVFQNDIGQDGVPPVLDMTNSLSPETLTGCLSHQNGIVLSAITLSPEQWAALQSIPLQAVRVGTGGNVTPDFLRFTSAARVRLRDEFSDALMEAVGMRPADNPIPNFFIKMVALSGGALVTDSFKRAIDRIQNLTIEGVFDDDDNVEFRSWCSFWKCVASSKSLVGSVCPDIPWMITIKHLKVVRKCLEHNWDLCSIDLRGRLSRRARICWPEHIQPLLDLNRATYCPSIEFVQEHSTEYRCRVVMEAIVCVRPHLGKLYTLLRAHCDTFCDIVTSSENV